MQAVRLRREASALVASEATDPAANVLLVLILIFLQFFFGDFAFFLASSFMQEQERYLSTALTLRTKCYFMLIIIYLHFLVVGDLGFGIYSLLHTKVGEKSLCRGH